jgi:hypothetical protein
MGNVIIDNTDKVLLKHDRVKDRALASAAQDIEVIVKSGGRTPLGPSLARGGKAGTAGGLRARTRHEKVSNKKYRIILPVAYAAYQERGSRVGGSHRVKHYTTPGTGKGFLDNAIHTVGRNFTNLVKQAARMDGF